MSHASPIVPASPPRPERPRPERPSRGLLAVLLCAALGAPATALADDENGIPEVSFERYKLANGLEVILHRDNRVPLVSVDLWYHVGAGDEVVGKSGFAHLFEHMLFQGSGHVGEDKHFSTLKNVGASYVQGTTNTDRTNYMETLPSNQLETALWLESDRMGYLLPLLTKKSLDNQIEVVRNERRQRIDNVPYGPSRMALYRAMYPDDHPYRWAIIGRHEDLASSTLEDVRNFYKKWYVPANATLVLAGDFEIVEAKKLIEKWFGSFPRSERPKQRSLPIPVIKRQRQELQDQFAKLRRVTYAWHTPGFFKDGDAEFDVLGNALSATGTGRLYKILVHEKQLAQGVRAYQASQQESSIFQIDVTLKGDADMREVERILDQEIDKLRTSELEQKDIDRVVTSVESSFVWGLEGLLARAELLQRYNHYVGTPDYVRQDLGRYAATTPAKVRAMAAKYLLPDRRVEIITIPIEGGAK